MRLKRVKVKKRFKFENLGILGLMIAILLSGSSAYLFAVGLVEWSNVLAKICILLFILSWLMASYGQYAKKRKKIVIEVIKKEDDYAVENRYKYL